MRYVILGLFLLLFGCGGSDSGTSSTGSAGSSSSVDPTLHGKVEQSTGWTFKTAPVFATISRRQLLERLEAKLQGEAGKRTAAAGRALQALGVLPKGYDLISNLKKMYGQEILALYDLKERKVFLIREALDKPPSREDLLLQKAGKPTTRDITIAHEMVHALQHQHDPLFELLEDTSPDLDDLRGALHALAEGEATVHMYALLGSLNVPQIVQGIEREAAGKFTDQPAILRDSMFFPYIWGTRYAANRTGGKETGSAPRLHAAPPLSMEHVLHPERTSQNDPPVALFLPDLSSAVGGGRALTYEGVVGERDLGHVFSATLEANQGGLRFSALQSGWGGDRLHLYEKPGEPPVAVVLIRFDRASAAFLAYGWLSTSAKDKARFSVVWNRQDLILVYGLPDETGRRVGRDALGRVVARPFRSAAEVRAFRTGLKFPSEAPAGLGDLESNLDALGDEVPDSDEFSNVLLHVERLSTKLAWTAAARYNLARQGKGQVRFGMGREAVPASWTPDELNMLIRGGGRIDVNSPINERLGECLLKYGREWPPEIVTAIVQWHHLQRKSQFGEFARKHAAVPGVARATLSCLYGQEADPQYHEFFLKAVEEGLLTPMDTRSLGLPALRSRLVHAHLTARLGGRIEWTDQFRAVFEGLIEHAEVIELQPFVIEKWERLPLTPKGRGFLLAQSLRDPKGWKRSLELAQKEVAAGQPEFWEGFSKPLGKTYDTRKLPHFKELVASLERLAADPKALPSLKHLAAALRRAERSP